MQLTKLLLPTALFVVATACGSSETNDPAGKSPAAGAAGKSPTTGTGGASNEGGAGPGSGAQTGSGEAGSGTGPGDAGSGNGGSGNGGSGNGLPSEPCEGSVQSTDLCETVDATCANQGSTSCCLCMAFEAPSCGKQWACALPENNGAECPEAPPAADGECVTAKLTCQYCTELGPVHMRCSKASGAAQAQWLEVPALVCSQ